jgi:protein phosphatase
MVRKGVINQENVPDHPMRGILTQAVGSHAELEVHLSEEEIEANDAVLLCSDGLYGAVNAAEISQIIASPAPVARRASDLIERALATNVSDNVSAILVEYK